MNDQKSAMFRCQSVHILVLFQTKLSQISVFSIEGIDYSVDNKMQRIQPERIEVLFILKQVNSKARGT